MQETKLQVRYFVEVFFYKHASNGTLVPRFPLILKPRWCLQILPLRLLRDHPVDAGFGRPEKFLLQFRAGAGEERTEWV